MKETFIVRTEWRDAIFELPLDEQAIILQNLFYYHAGEENLINLNNLRVKLVWLLIEPNLKRNAEAYDKRIETSKENGKKGGRPKENKNLKKPKKPTITLSDTVSVTVSDNDSKSVSKIDRIFIAPTELEVIDYFKENGYAHEVAIKAFRYYATANWKDSKGNRVKNWKQKMISVWFKDENKAPPPAGQKIRTAEEQKAIDDFLKCN